MNTTKAVPLNHLFVKKFYLIRNKSTGKSIKSLFLGKKVFSVPMKGQYEQICNAEALHKMGISVVHELDEAAEILLDKWLEAAQGPKITFPDNVEAVVAQLLNLISKATNY